MRKISFNIVLRLALITTAAVSIMAPSIPARAEDICVFLAKNSLFAKEHIASTDSSSRSFRRRVKNTLKQIHEGTINGDAEGHYSIAGGTASYTQKQLENMDQMLSGDMSAEAGDNKTIESYKEFLDPAATNLMTQCINLRKNGLSTEVTMMDDGNSIHIESHYIYPLGIRSSPAKLNSRIIKENLNCTGNLSDGTLKVIENENASATCSRPTFNPPKIEGDRIKLADKAEFNYPTIAGDIFIHLPENVVFTQEVIEKGTDANVAIEGTPVPFPFHRRGEGDESYGFTAPAEMTVTFKVVGGSGSSPKLLRPVLRWGSASRLYGDIDSEAGTESPPWIIPFNVAFYTNPQLIAKQTWVGTYKLCGGCRYSLRIQPISGETSASPTYPYDLSMSWSIP